MSSANGEAAVINILAHAKNDPAAESVAAALGSRILARMLVGERTPDLELGYATVIVVWSAYAGAHGASGLGHLCGGASRTILVKTDDAPFAGISLRNVQEVDWRTAGGAGLLRALKAGLDDEETRSRFDMAKIAAGLFAALGAATPAGAALANTPAITATSGQRQTRSARAEQTVAIAAPAETSELELEPLVFDLDALPQARPDAAAAAKALVEYVPPEENEPAGDQAQTQARPPMLVGMFTSP